MNNYTCCILEFIGFDKDVLATESWLIVLDTLRAAENGNFTMQRTADCTPAEALQLTLKYGHSHINFGGFVNELSFS